MEELIGQLAQPQFFYLGLTIGVFILSGKLQQKTGWFIFNPLLFSSIAIMIFLMVFDIDYDTYSEGGQYLSIFINLATVSLAILLEKNYDYLKADLVAILSGVAIGVVIHAIVVVLISGLVGLDQQMTATLLPKSITTAIAAPTSASLGGIPELTVGFAIIACIIGSVLGPPLLKAMGITNPIAQGNALGGSSAAMGTAAAIGMGSVQGSVASSGLVLSGVITVVVAPLVMQLLGGFF